MLDAAGELDWEVQFLDDGGIWMDDGDAEFYFEQYDLRQNAELVIGTLRREVCYVADACPDELDNWSEAGLNALAEWEKSDHQ